MQSGNNIDDGFVCRLRGLPWSATADDVTEFFGENVRIVPNGVHFTFSREGRPSGEAFIELESEEDVEAALTRHKDHMGQRYIEVFRSKQSEMEWVVKRSSRNQPQSGEAVLRLRGLPFGCSKEEIAQFFSGLELVPNGIMLPEDRHGRTTGDAYVQFATCEIAEKALLKHKERIGHSTSALDFVKGTVDMNGMEIRRYIEIFKSSLNEATANIYQDFGMAKQPRPLMGMRPSPYNRNERMMGGGGMGGNMGMGGGMGYGRGRGGRNLKGFYDDDYDDDMGFGNNMGGGSGRMGMGSMGGGMGMGMNRRGGNMRQQGMSGQGRMGGDRMGMMKGGSQPGCHYISKTGHSVHMRGLPFQANDQDVADFFSPLVPVKVEFEFNNQGRPTGEANVDFSTHQEAKEAMKKHKANMQHRYIELFLNSTPSNRSDGMFGGDDFQGEGDMDMMGGMRKGNMGGGFGGGFGMNNMGGGDGFSNMGSNMRSRMNNNPNYTAF